MLDAGKKSAYYYVEKFLVSTLRYDRLISVGKSFLRHPNRNHDIAVIPNGVTLENFQGISQEKEKDFFKILFVGRYEWTKGLEVLIESLHLMEAEFLEKQKIQVHLI